MAHGYLGDGYGKDGNRDPDDGSDDHRRNEWRGEQRGEWGDRDHYDRGSDRGRFMFDSSNRGGNAGWDRSDAGDDRDHGDNRGRGFFARTAEETRDWFRDDEHDYRPGAQERGGGGGRSSGGNRYGQPSAQQRQFSTHQDDHYLSWRQQQMDALDRDYQDYCRERQQQFHSDFDTWRRNRQSQQGSGQQPSGKQSQELELSERDELAGTTSAHNEPQATVSPVGDATLGTNNSENSVTRGS